MSFIRTLSSVYREYGIAYWKNNCRLNDDDYDSWFRETARNEEHMLRMPSDECRERMEKSVIDGLSAFEFH